MFSPIIDDTARSSRTKFGGTADYRRTFCGDMVTLSSTVCSAPRGVAKPQQKKRKNGIRRFIQSTFHLIVAMVLAVASYLFNAGVDGTLIHHQRPRASLLVHDIHHVPDVGLQSRFYGSVGARRTRSGLCDLRVKRRGCVNNRQDRCAWRRNICSRNGEAGRTGGTGEL